MKKTQRLGGVDLRCSCVVVFCGSGFIFSSAVAVVAVGMQTTTRTPINFSVFLFHFDMLCLPPPARRTQGDFCRVHFVTAVLGILIVQVDIPVSLLDF